MFWICLQRVHVFLEQTCGVDLHLLTLSGVRCGAKVTYGLSLIRGTQRGPTNNEWLQFCFHFTCVFGLELASVLSSLFACSVSDYIVMGFGDKA